MAEASAKSKAAVGADSEPDSLKKQPLEEPGEKKENAPETIDYPVPKREDFPSKNAYKKALKDRYKTLTKIHRKAEKKKEEQAAKKEKKRKRLEEYSKLSSDEKQARVKKKLEGIDKRKEDKTLEKKRLNAVFASGESNLVIDLDFHELMTVGERRSLGHQVMYCYSNNKKAEKPCRLCLTGLQGSAKETMDKMTGSDNWRVVREEKPYIEAFQDRKEDLVYLTADSENVIETFDPKKIYIIGGIVDRNRHKNLCQNKAEQQGIQTAQLPIQQHIKLVTSCVLTVNQVFDIYLKFRELEDWDKALRAVIPARKIKSTTKTDDAQNN
jgi:tRNA (guanine9-N1)-methyltransferase